MKTEVQLIEYSIVRQKIVDVCTCWHDAKRLLMMQAWRAIVHRCVSLVSKSCVELKQEKGTV